MEVKILNIMVYKNSMLALLGLLMMGCCLLSACSASVENTPEGVATFVVNSYMKGKYPDTREYATQDVM